MSFFIFTILKDENAHLVGDFLTQATELKLPCRVGVIDMRTKIFDATRKILKKYSTKGIYFFTSKSKDEYNAFIAGLFHAKSELYLASAFVSLEMDLDELQLATLLVRSQDTGACVPKTFLKEKGLGFEIVIPTQMDFGVVYCKQLTSDMTCLPSKVFAISQNSIHQIEAKANNLFSDHKLYRFFTANNIRFQLVDDCIFKERY